MTTAQPATGPEPAVDPVRTTGTYPGDHPVLRGDRLLWVEGCEFLPNVVEAGSGVFFVEFFQRDRNGD